MPFDRPGDNNGNDLQKCGQDNHQQRQAIETERIADAEPFDPGDILVEEPARAAAGCIDKQPDGNGQDHQGDHQGIPAAFLRLMAMQPAEYRTDQRQNQQQGQPGEIGICRNNLIHYLPFTLKGHQPPEAPAEQSQQSPGKSTDIG